MTVVEILSRRVERLEITIFLITLQIGDWVKTVEMDKPTEISEAKLYMLKEIVDGLYEEIGDDFWL